MGTFLRKNKTHHLNRSELLNFLLEISLATKKLEIHIMFLKVTKTLALMCGFSRSQDALHSTKIPTVLVFKLMSNYIY